MASIGFSQLFLGAMQFRCNCAHVDLVCVARRIVARRTDNESNFFWTRQTAAFRPRVKSTLQIAGQNHDVAPGYQRADSRIEFPGLTCFRSRAFNKEEQYIIGIAKKVQTDGENET